MQESIGYKNIINITIYPFFSLFFPLCICKISVVMVLKQPFDYQKKTRNKHKTQTAIVEMIYHTRYQCKECDVGLYIIDCFKAYHTPKYN